MGSVKVPPASVYNSARGKKMNSKKAALVNTVTQYSEASSIHGISYIFGRSQGAAPRVVWLLIVVGFAALGIYWSVEVRS
jgi:hypothetical protein